MGNLILKQDQKRSTSKTLQLDKLALEEANRHRWIESEKAGRDLGDEALRDWSNRFWFRFCRERWIEHLSGKCFWSELDKNDFDLLNRNFHPNRHLVSFVANRIREGGENLDIIQMGLNRNYKIEELLEILKILDINSRRIPFRT